MLRRKGFSIRDEEAEMGEIKEEFKSNRLFLRIRFEEKDAFFIQLHSFITIKPLHFQGSIN